MWLSSIFDWFEEDFEPGGGVVATLLDYLPPDVAAVMRSQRDEFEIEYLDYDWSLNRMSPAAS